MSGSFDPPPSAATQDVSAEALAEGDERGGCALSIETIREAAARLRAVSPAPGSGGFGGLSGSPCDGTVFGIPYVVSPALEPETVGTWFDDPPPSRNRSRRLWKKLRRRTARPMIHYPVLMISGRIVMALETERELRRHTMATATPRDLAGMTTDFERFERHRLASLARAFGVPGRLVRGVIDEEQST